MTDRFRPKRYQRTARLPNCSGDPHDCQSATPTSRRCSLRRNATPFQVCRPGRASAGVDRRAAAVRTPFGRNWGLGTAVRWRALALTPARLRGAGACPGGAGRRAGGGDTGLPRFLHRAVQAFLRFHRSGCLGRHARAARRNRWQRPPCLDDRSPASAAFQFFFQARTLPLGVYATDRDFLDYRVHSQALAERASLAVQRALPLIELTRHARSITAQNVAAA